MNLNKYNLLLVFCAGIYELSNFSCLQTIFVKLLFGELSKGVFDVKRGFENAVFSVILVFPEVAVFCLPLLCTKCPNLISTSPVSVKQKYFDYFCF